MSLTKSQSAAIRRSLSSGMSHRGIAHCHSVPVAVIEALANASKGSKVQASYSSQRAEVAAINKKYQDQRKAEGIQPITFTQNQLNLSLTKCYDEASKGSYPAVNECLGLAGVTPENQDAISRRAVTSMNREAWTATATHPEAMAMNKAGFRTRNDKADSCNSSVSHLLKSIQTKHVKAVSHLSMLREIEELKARLAIVEDNININPVSKAEAMGIASKMKAKGSTQAEIAFAVQKTERTIRRWWSEL